MEPGKAKWICAKHGRMSPELLLEWVGIAGPPVDAVALAETLDVIVAFDDLGQYTSVLAMNERNAGILVKATADRATQRFAVAHQIGHLVLHEGVEFRQAESDAPIDIEANLYATRLLMPASWLEAGRVGRGAGGAVRRVDRLRTVRPSRTACE